MRINRYLAAAGYGSRRACEELIRRGSVRVNGAVLTKLAAVIDPEADAVTVDGQPARLPARIRVLALNKPVGVMSTVTDTHGRRTVVDIVRGLGVGDRLFPVGRLDLDSSGILILTNDGDLAYRLMHPRFKIEKRYRVTVTGDVDGDTAAAVGAGVDLDGYRTKPCRVEIVRRTGGTTTLDVYLKEGRKRQIRRMLARFGHPVVSLERTALGDLTFDDLAPGAARDLTSEEERRLRELAGLVREGEE